MGYLGNSNQVQNFVPAVDYFNGNGSTTAFTLSRTVGSAFDIQAFIENVPQNPSSAFTVAGNVITFTSAPPSGTNNIYVRYTSPVVQQVKPAPGTVGPTELNSAYSLWNLSGSDINYTAGNVLIGTTSATFRYTGAGQTATAKQTISTSGYDCLNLISTAANPGIDFSQLNSSSSVYRFAHITGVMTTNTAGSESGDIMFATGSAGSNAAERMRITSDGKIGVGTSSPDPALEIRSVSRTSDSTRYNIVAIDTSSYAQGNGGGINFGYVWNSNGDAMGRAVNIKGIKENSNNNDYASALVFSTTQHSASTTERMRISSIGNLLVNTTTEGGSTPGRFIVYYAQNTHWGMFINNTLNNSGSYAIGFGSGGNLVGRVETTASATSFVTSSDYRLKENIAPMTGALDKITQLKPCTFTWKIDGTPSQGFIAHELQEIVPEAVNGEKDAVNEDGSIRPQGVDTSFLVATLTAAIQEQQSIIENLKARIEVLEAK